VQQQELEELQVAHDLSAITATRLVPLPQPEQGYDFLSAEATLGKVICFRYIRLYRSFSIEVLFNRDAGIHMIFPFRMGVFFSNKSLVAVPI
jgi:hypothetical protein